MKLVADKQTRHYEVTYLVPTTFTDAERKTIDEAVAAVVAKRKGTVVSTEDWGKKHLAYTIDSHGKKHTEAFYTHMVVSLDPSKTQAFEKDLYLEERIIRHLLVIATETTVSPSEVEEVASEEEQQ